MSEARKLRRPPAGGYARGDETRQRIIEAALECFGAHGFAGASTREIAARAGVNAPALQYYFENKDGVYRACIEAMADHAWRSFAPAIEHAHAVLADAEATPEAAIEAFLQIQAAVTHKMMSVPEVKEPSMRLFFVREQMGEEPPEATEILMRRVRLPLNRTCAALLERITGEPADSELTRIRVFTVFGQSLMFHIAPRTTLSVLEWPDFGAGRSDRVRAILLGQTRVLLERWQAERA